MADALSTMTKAKWDELKRNAQIPTTSIFKTLLGGAANVGSAIEKYQAARKDWKAFKSASIVKTYVKALDGLISAFDKFTKIKEFKTEEAKELAKAIKVWKQAAADKKQKVLQFAAENKDALKANDHALLLVRLEEAGLV